MAETFEYVIIGVSTFLLCVFFWIVWKKAKKKRDEKRKVKIIKAWRASLTAQDLPRQATTEEISQLQLWAPGNYEIINHKTRCRETLELDSTEKGILRVGTMVQILRFEVFDSRIRGNLKRGGWITVKNLNENRQLVQKVESSEESTSTEQGVFAGSSSSEEKECVVKRGEPSAAARPRREPRPVSKRMPEHFRAPIKARSEKILMKEEETSSESYIDSPSDSSYKGEAYMNPIKNPPVHGHETEEETSENHHHLLRDLRRNETLDNLPALPGARGAPGSAGRAGVAGERGARRAGEPERGRRRSGQAQKRRCGEERRYREHRRAERKRGPQKKRSPRKHSEFPPGSPQHAHSPREYYSYEQGHYHPEALEDVFFQRLQQRRKKSRRKRGERHVVGFDGTPTPSAVFHQVMREGLLDFMRDAAAQKDRGGSKRHPARPAEGRPRRHTRESRFGRGDHRERRRRKRQPRRERSHSVPRRERRQVDWYPTVYEGHHFPYVEDTPEDQHYFVSPFPHFAAPAHYSPSMGMPQGNWHGSRLSDAITEIGYIMGYPSSGWCEVQAFLITFGYVSSAFWVLNVAHVLHRVVVDGFLNKEKLTTLYHGYTWITSLILSLLPFISNSYGHARGFCWIKLTGYHTLWRLATYYIPRCGVFMYSLYVYVLEYFYKSEVDLGKNSARKRLFWYPAALFFCAIWSIVAHATNNVQEIFSGDSNGTNVWNAVANAFDGLYGLVNVLLFFQAGIVRTVIFHRDSGSEGQLLNRSESQTESEISAGQDDSNVYSTSVVSPSSGGLQSETRTFQRNVDKPKTPVQGL